MRRLLKNLTANSLGIGINLLGQLFAVPLFLHLWNKQLYGEWLVLTTVPNLLWSLDGGLGGIAANRMTLASAASNWKEVNAIFQTTLVGQFCLSLFIFSVTLAVVCLTSVKKLFGFIDLSAHDSAYILVFMISYMLGGLVITLLRAPYRASEMEARGSMLTNCWRITDFGITVTILFCHGSPFYLAVGQLSGVLAWNLLGVIDVTRKCPNVHFGVTHLSWRRFLEMIIHGLPLIAGQAATALYMQGYPLVVNRTLGSAAVVTLNTMRMLCRLSLLIIQLIVWSSSPILSRSYGAEDWQKYYRLLRVVVATALWVGLSGLAGFTTLGPEVLSLWTGGKVHSDHLTFFFFALSIAFQGIGSCLASILACSNRHHAFSYVYTAGTVLAVFTAPWIIIRGGFIAVPMLMASVDLTIMLVGLYFCRTRLTNFHYNELHPLLTFSYYKDGLFYLIKRFQDFRANPGQA